MSTEQEVPKLSRSKKYKRAGTFFVLLYVVCVIWALFEGMQISGPAFGSILMAVYASPLLLIGFSLYVLSEAIGNKEKKERTWFSPSKKILVGVAFLILHYTGIVDTIFKTSKYLAFGPNILFIFGWILLIIGLANLFQGWKDKNRK